MAVTEIKGKKFMQIALGESGGDYVMSSAKVIREVRLTNIDADDYMIFYEAVGSNPKIFKLDYDRPATMLSGKTPIKIGFNWSDCSVATPNNAILSIEFE
jgi:hypothetical protein